MAVSRAVGKEAGLPQSGSLLPTPGPRDENAVMEAFTCVIPVLCVMLRFHFVQAVPNGCPWKNVLLQELPLFLMSVHTCHRCVCHLPYGAGAVPGDGVLE